MYVIERETQQSAHRALSESTQASQRITTTGYIAPFTKEIILTFLVVVRTFGLLVMTLDPFQLRAVNVRDDPPMIGPTEVT